MSFKYRFVPVWPAVFSELRHGIEVWVHRGDGSTVGEGSTVELRPGDHVESDAPITGGGDSTDTHPHLEAVDTIPAPAAAPESAPVAPVAEPEPTTPTDPPAPVADHQES